VIARLAGDSLCGDSPAGVSTWSLHRAERHAGLHTKCPLLLPDFNQNLSVSTNFRKTTSIIIHIFASCCVIISLYLKYIQLTVYTTYSEHKILKH
jgi:hypothetical protein